MMLIPPISSRRFIDGLRILTGFFVGLTAFPGLVDAQIYVYPRRPTQSNVRYTEFDWQYVDILVGPAADPDSADGIDFHSPVQSLHGSMHQDRVPHLPTWFHPTARFQGLLYGPGSYTFQGSPLAREFPDPTEDTRTEPPPPPFPPTDSTPDAERPRSDKNDDEDRASDEEDTVELTSRTGGVRLYFYEQEREIAEKAAAYIEESYRYLVDRFRYVPTETLPYVLYNSYQDFLQTNIFPVQEGVLGVTGRRDMKLVLPYFGDHRLFEHISTHEMVHQFTIQKARQIAKDAGIPGDPLDQMPLWFIEGMAEYYALRGLDPEAEMLTRDLLLNPDPTRGYVMLDFFEDRPFSSLWTYKVGQTRVAFLEEVYGEGILQDLMEASHRLLGRRSEDAENAPLTFRRLLVEITGDEAQRIADRFERWIKERSYSRFLASEQDSSDLVFLNNLRGLMQQMTSSPDGKLLMYRSISPETGRISLFAVDSRDASTTRRIASDGVPGVESLHPVGPRNFDIRTDRVVYSARSEGVDILYLQELHHQAARDDEENWDITLKPQSRRAFDLSRKGIVAAELPTFSPDGRRVAFVGLNQDGQKNLYLFEALEGQDFLLSALTENESAPRGLSWGEEGLVFTSNRTGHGFYNLFRLDPRQPASVQRLTFEGRDHFDPRVMPDGRVFFSAYSESRANIYEVRPDTLVRRTDIVTGLFGIAPGPGQSVWATFHHRGQRRPVRIAAERLLDHPMATSEDHESPEPIAVRSLESAEPYRASSLGNWQLSHAFGLLGASSAGVYGQLALLTNDRLRNHALFVNLLAFGDLNNTIADVLYLNQEKRLIWGTGLFQDVRYRIDRSVESDQLFLSGERFYGGRGTLRFPLNRFLFLQGDLALGGVGFFLQNRTQELMDPEIVNAWEDLHDGHRLQVSPSASIGLNTIRYHPGTGPIAGTSLLLEATVDVQPFNEEVHGTVRLDAEHYIPIYNRINLGVRGGMGTTYGGDLRRQFYLSSFDTLRGVEFGDPNYLLGDVFFFSKVELRFPLNFLLRVPLIDIEGIVAMDFGGAGVDPEDLWASRALAPVAGFNFGLGPLVFRLHFAKPLGIGAQYATPRDGDWITNFSLGWRY